MNRKIRKASILQGTKNPRDFGEERPPFYQVQARYKLLYKLLQDRKNTTLVQRKPFPEDRKAEFVAASKEYSMYKYAEKQRILKE